MERSTSDARLARYDPYAYQTQPRREVERATVRPVDYPDQPEYHQPVYYRPPMDSHARVQIVGMCIAAGIFLVLVLCIILAWVTAPPAPIVSHSNPSCVVWCG